ncbi:hypothetical protein BJF93_22385 [Xaviernesmea oryzae]|uniref:Sensor protein FixL n=1 Tax=Xaviernesmea oryzae TaxID=464029 RepID=A0A1Q9B321_9HYPH|nr:PAS domain-containing sensor histidine kinase [Xaviernesmea oryzae]OLP62416.1 hypothetical protein BJF93_22385 [Xaviernesmea oryzae]SEM15690.1 PAS domain S-box-containing protein [Xaviernesmea oryzae]
MSVTTLAQTPGLGGRLMSISGHAAAVLCIMLGGVVLLLWIVQPAAVVADYPAIFVTELISALCFVLTGLALWMMLADARKAGTIFCLLSIAIAGDSLIFDVFNWDPGLDALLPRLFAHAARQPKHVVGGTALCFILIDLAILRTILKGGPSHWSIALPALVFMIAAGTILTYALHLGVEPRWLPLKVVSPYTTLCFLALSLALIFHHVRLLDYHRQTVAAMLASATYVLLLLLTLLGLESSAEGAVPLLSGPETHDILAAVLLASGVIFTVLVVYAFRNAQRHADVAAQLSESQQRLAAIIETAVDGFITIDERGTILSINAACERIFGYPARDMLGQNVRMLMPDPYRRDHDGYMRNYHATGRAKVIGIGREVEGLRRNGTTFPLDLAVTRIELPHQVIYSGIVRDISERKRQERALLEANAEMEEFSYRTSHDLRSPIASALGLAAIAREMTQDGAPPEAVAQVIERIDGGLRRLDRLIQDIIALTRTKLLEEPAAELALADAVRETIERLRFIGSGRRIAFSVEADKDLVIATKISRVQMILDNLISNAIKYSDPQEEAPYVRVLLRLEGDMISITVSDNGLGIDSEQQRHLFQMFRRFHPGHSQGSGLGLYILRKSVEHLGGSVAYHPLDKGSAFVVRFPARTCP